MKHRLSRISAVGVWLALLGVTLRALLPVGFMPATSRAGGPAFVFCTSQGATTVSVDDQGRRLKPVATHTEQCPFGFALSMSAAPTSMAPWEFEPGLPGLAAQPSAVSPNFPAPNWYSSRAPPLES